jgi:hypothetical protein
MLIEYMKVCRDFLFADGTNRFYEGVSFTEDIYGSEEYPRSVIDLFFIKYLTAFTRRIYLSDRCSVKSLISINCYKLFFFPCHR